MTAVRGSALPGAVHGIWVMNGVLGPSFTLHRGTALDMAGSN
jgi:hypothetical protein